MQLIFMNEQGDESVGTISLLFEIEEEEETEAEVETQLQQSLEAPTDAPAAEMLDDDCTLPLCVCSCLCC